MEQLKAKPVKNISKKCIVIKRIPCEKSEPVDPVFNWGTMAMTMLLLWVMSAAGLF